MIQKCVDNYVYIYLYKLYKGENGLQSSTASQPDFEDLILNTYEEITDFYN